MDAYIVVTVLLLLFAQLINSALEDSVFPVYGMKACAGERAGFCTHSTTTVIMKAHKSVDESVSRAVGVDNGFDLPRVASAVETSTRPASI